MKLSQLFGVIVLLSMLLAACSQPVAPAAAPPAADQTTAADTSATAAEPVNLKLTIWGSDLDAQVYQQRLDLFKAQNPDINVELVYIPSDYSQKVQTMIAGGTAPDIMQVAEEVHGYSDKGQIIALNDFVAQDNVDLKAR